jgi:UDP-N-acetylmuramoylalanine--D-glutamate ligase
MKVAVLGYGIEGRSAVKYWLNKGDEVTIRDAKTVSDAPSGVNVVTGVDYLSDLGTFDLIVRTQSIKPALIFKSNPGLKSGCITTIINEFMLHCPAPVIGVTGTKGKGTTSSLIAEILKQSGKIVHLGGNIGTSPLDFLAKINPSDYVVLELSSFQTMDLQTSPHIAVILMIASDHMDWHTDMAEYIQAKAQMVAHQKSSDRVIFNGCNLASIQIANSSNATKVPFNSHDGSCAHHSAIWMNDTKLAEIDQVGLIGPHNLDNICAAVAATWPIVGSVEPIRKALTTFTGLPHRLQFVAKLNGVSYYDDSFSTNPQTAIAAIKSFNQPKVLILGGSDKKSDFTQLAKEVKLSDVKHVVLIGATAPQIKQALSREGFSQYSEGSSDMDQIVKQASDLAASGDVVLLSPGCASFGLFANYKQRGDKFSNSVRQLA